MLSLINFCHQKITSKKNDFEGCPFFRGGSIKTSYKTSFRDGLPLESISRGDWYFPLPLGIASIFKGGWYYGAPLETEAFVRLENPTA